MDSTRPTLLLTGCLLAAGLLLPCQAEITLDGSLGNELGALTLGPNQEFTITEDLGKKVGSNLFHSFGVFNIDTGETATFSGTSPIENILSRVTGGSASNIDGTLRTDFANATPNLFLINPSGVLFGPNASLDVQGSFHVSTADFLRLEDGARFNSVPSAEDQVLTTAPPEAFGFLGENPAGIAVLESIFEVPEGEALSIVGGDIDITGGPLGFLEAPSGQINIVSADSSGEVRFEGSDLELSEFERLGEITVSDVGLIDVGGDGGGRILIRGGQFEMDNSVVRSSTSGEVDGGMINIVAREKIDIANGSVILTDTISDARAGDISIETKNLAMASANIISSSNEFIFGEIAPNTGRAGDINIKATESAAIQAGGLISGRTLSEGDAGNIFINTPELMVADDGRIGVSSFGNGAAGDLSIKTERLSLLNGGSLRSEAGGMFQEDGSGGIGAEGTPGVIDIVASEFVSISGQSLLQRSALAVNNLGQSDGGSITLNTPLLSMENGALIQANTIDKGDAGVISILANEISLDQARIEASTLDAGDGGNITVDSNNVVVNGVIDIGNAGFFVGTLDTEPDSGKGGSLSLSANTLELSNGGRISATTEGPGQGGNVDIAANQILVNGVKDGSASGIFVNSDGEVPKSGDGGILTLTVDTLEVNAGAAVAGITNGPGQGGEINVEASNTIDLRAGGVITSDTFGSGSGGDLKVEAKDILIEGIQVDESGTQSSQISSSSQIDQVEPFTEENSGGESGNVFVKADSIKVLNGGRIQATTDNSGKGGDVTIEDTNFIEIQGHGGGVLSAISARSQGDGDSGNLFLDTEALEVLNGGRVDASASGLGKGGNITIEAKDISLESFSQNFLDENGNNIPIPSEIAAVSGLNTEKGGGSIDINTTALAVRNGARVSASTLGPGNAGTLNIRAEEVTLEGPSTSLFPTGLNVSAENPGESGMGGDLTINANTLKVIDEAFILGFTIGSGPGGDLSIVAQNIEVSNNAGIVAASGSEDPDAKSGTIAITASDSFTIQNGGVVTVETTQANAGNIELKVEKLLLLRDQGAITTSAAGGMGSGGNITIDPDFVVLDNSDITATAVAGAGGNISIVSDFIFQSPGSEISASSERGIDGTVDIDSLDTNISGSIAVLPETYINASDQLSERCAARSANLNSFTVKGRGVVPPLAPEDFAPSTSQDNGPGGKISKNEAAMGYRHASYVESSKEKPGLSETDGDDPHLTALGFGCGQ